MKIIENSSGTFYITDDGILEKFLPRQKAGPNGFHPVEKLIIPEGVAKIGTRALDCLAVTEAFRFPESLRAIGTELWESGLSWCDLPDVVIPEGVREITSFAFGKCRIRSLRVPRGVVFTGGRHFKGSHIGTLYLPEACKEDPPGEQFSGLSPLAAIHNARGNNLMVDEIIWYHE